MRQLKSVFEYIESCCKEGLDDELSGWIVSCDARLFNKAGNMPTVVFGPGSLKDAHSNHEQIRAGDIIKAARVLARFLIENK